MCINKLEWQWQVSLTVKSADSCEDIRLWISMEVVFKIPVTSSCTLMEHEFHKCQPFAVWTGGRIFGSVILCIDQNCQEKKNKISQGICHVMLYPVHLCLEAPITFLCGSFFGFVFKSLAKIIWCESKWKGNGDFSGTHIYSIPGFSICSRWFVYCFIILLGVWPFIVGVCLSKKKKKKTTKLKYACL